MANTEPNEVERLRARVAELESQLASEPTLRIKRPEARRSRWWAISVATLITLACVLAPLSVTAVWASTVLSDTEQYVETVAPLADDPAVQSAVADKVTAVVLESIDIEGLTSDALDALAEQENLPPRVADALPALAVPITNGVEDFARTQINSILASPQFAAAWEQVNRIAHEQVLTLLEGNAGGAVSAQDDSVTLNLGPIIEQVKDRLIAQGFTLASNIPAVDVSFVLVQSEAVTNVQSVYRLLSTLGFWLPLIALALFAAGVALASDHRRALLRGSLGVVVAMVVLGVALAVARLLYVEATPADVLTEQAAGSVFDTLVRFLRTGLRALAALGLIVALAAFLTGPTTGAVRTRSALERGIGSLRGGAESAGWTSGRVGTWIYANKRRLRVSAAVAGGLVLMFWTRPTAWVVVVTAVVVVLVIAVLEFLASPPVPQGSITTDEPAAPADEPTAPTMPRQLPRTSAEGRGPSDTPVEQEAASATGKEPSTHG